MVAYTLYAVDPRVKRAARALAEKGHQVDVFAVFHEAAAEDSESGELSRVRLLHMRKRQTGIARHALEYGIFFAWAFGLVSFLHFRRRYDVVYVHNMPNFLVFTGLLPKLGRAKIVLDVHDPAEELLADMRGRDLGRWTRRFVDAEQRVSISFSDALITVNEPMRRRLSVVTGLPVAVVMNLPDRRSCEPAAASCGREDLDWLVYTG